MYPTTIDELKKLKVTDPEVVQLVKLKQAGASDEFCMSMFKVARSRNLDFVSGESAVRLSQAGYSDAQILEMAQSGQIDLLSGEAITLKLIGLPIRPSRKLFIAAFRVSTLTSAQIGRLKNTGMSEKQILDLIDQGLSGKEAERQIAQREASRNHSNTNFVRVKGRRRRYFRRASVHLLFWASEIHQENLP
jgi:hypothetical protein